MRHIHEIGASTIALNRMVLLRSWVSLDIQQRLVHERQSAAHLFHCPTTAGGGKYHIYSDVWFHSLAWWVASIYVFPQTVILQKLGSMPKSVIGSYAMNFNHLFLPSLSWVESVH